MKASFVLNRSARAELKQLKAMRDNPLNFLPRVTRKTLRVTTPKQATANTHDGVDSYMAQCEYRRDDYYNQNLYEIDYDHDEFADIDNQYEGLTIVECSGEAELFEFCTGYNI